MLRLTASLLCHLAAVFPLATGISRCSFAGERIRDGDTVRIGMVRSLFKDVPESTVTAMMQPFGAVMRAQTGVKGELVCGGSPDELARQIADRDIHLGVLHGIEYAWARVKYPEIRPLVIAVNYNRHLRAHLVVSKNNLAARLEELQGKTLALPPKSRDHCLMFLQRRCQQCQRPPGSFFAKITSPPNAVEALEDVVDGIAQVTIIDAVALDWFKEQKPGRYAKLRILETSEAFPAGVIVYREDTIDEATLNKFRSGMTNMKNTIVGREFLTLWHLSAFEPVPDDYGQTLADIVKVYPPPAHNGK
jgi:ABC-type phosphate/phosphonate transport system substrate-binding protein